MLSCLSKLQRRTRQGRTKIQGLGATALNAVVVGLAFCCIIISGSSASEIAPVDQPAVRADRQFLVAAEHYQRGNWALAVEEFSVYLSEFPDQKKAPLGRFFLAESLMQLRRWDQAVDAFTEYLGESSDPDYVRTTRFRLAEIAYFLQDFPKAKMALDDFCRRYPNDKTLRPFALGYLGEIAFSQKRFDEATTYFETVLDAFPDSPRVATVRMGLAQAAEAQGAFDEARENYHTLLEADQPIAWEARFRLAQLEFRQKRFNRALTILAPCDLPSSKANGAGQTDWLARGKLLRALILRRENRHAEASVLLESLRSEKTLAARAEFQIGLICQEEKTPEETLRYWTAWIEKYPGHTQMAPARLRAGETALKLGELDRAEREFDLILGSDHKPPLPDSVGEDASYGKIQVAFQRDRRQVESLSEESKSTSNALPFLAKRFQKEFPRSEHHDRIVRLLARSYLNHRAWEKAIDVLRPLAPPALSGDNKKLSDDEAETRYLFGRACEGTGRFDNARQILDPVIRENQDGPFTRESRLTYASVLMAQGHFAEALATLNRLQATLDQTRAAEADSTWKTLSINARSRRAICAARTGDFTLAETLYNQWPEDQTADPLFLPMVSHLAEAAFDAKKWNLSALWFERLAQDGKGKLRIQGFSGLAWSQFEAGQLEAAAATFGHLLREYPEPEIAAEAAQTRGHLFEKIDRPDAALAMYDMVINRYPNCREFPKALLAAARLSDRLEQNDRAATLYDRWLDTCADDPLHAMVLYESSWVLAELEKEEDSLARCRQIVDTFPESPYRLEAAYRLALSAFENDQLAKAKAVLEPVLTDDSTNDSGRDKRFVLRWEIAAAESDWRGLADTAERYIKLCQADKNPSSDTTARLAEFWIAESHFRRESHEAAENRFAKLLEKTADVEAPWVAMISLRQAQVHGHQSRWDEAYRLAIQIEKRFPDFPRQYEVNYLIGRCLAARADFDGARRVYQKVIDSPGGRDTETAAMAQWMIGESYFHQRDYERAVREYLRVEILFPYPKWQAAALLEAGKCYERLEQKDKACRNYRRITRQYAQTGFVEEANERLGRLQYQTASRTNTAQR